MTVAISVAMATYNGETFIREQLASIANQTIPPFELVVCDDGSTDSTIRILHEFAATSHFPVRIVRNDENLGFSNNFLKCASLCRGDWIAFSDQDDVWLPNKLFSIQNTIASSSHELLLVYHMAEVVDATLQPLGYRLPAIEEAKTTGVGASSALWFVGGCVMCFKAMLVNDIDPSLRPRDNFEFNPGWTNDSHPWMPHDKWICMLANILGETSAMPDVLGLYRRHGSTVTGNHATSTTTARIQQSTATGTETYHFLSMIFLETSHSFASLSNAALRPMLKTRLRDGAHLAELLSRAYASRARLYTATQFDKRSRIMLSMVRNSHYFGRPPFSSLGTPALLKDVAFVTGLLEPLQALSLWTRSSRHHS